jgi:nucleoside-diphosphate kinase
MLKNNITLAIIKPKVVKDNKVGHLIKMVEDANFKIKALKLTDMTYELAKEFYKVHKDRPFYHDLCLKMSSWSVIPMILERENAVPLFRNLIGATNPADAEEGTIRKVLGESLDDNAVHGSDSVENAYLECKFFFPHVFNT